jgi:hypothetical protein
LNGKPVVEMLKPIKSILYRLLISRLMSPVRRLLIKIVNNSTELKHEAKLYSFEKLSRKDEFKIIKLTKQDMPLLIDDFEAYQVLAVAKKTMKIEGDIAEVGVYKGGSAKLICTVKGSKNLHLFDTFEGLPDVLKIDATRYQKGQFTVSLEEVKSNLSGYENVFFYKGIFPETGETVKDRTFSFVNLDVDIYESTINSLKFFYPRMNTGGVILSHDYNFAEGVKKAFDEYFEDKPEVIIELMGTQCVVVCTNRIAGVNQNKTYPLKVDKGRIDGFKIGF